MRKIDNIIIHCTASREGQDWSVEGIKNYHVKTLGWKDIGYHYVIYRDGSVHEGRPVEQVGAHTAGHNATSVGVCYVGGVAKDGKTAKDTRTPEQKTALVKLVRELCQRYMVTQVHGHNEYANKACPSFDVRKWQQEVGLFTNGSTGGCAMK